MFTPMITRTVLLGAIALTTICGNLALADQPPILKFSVTGPEQTVYAYVRDKCDPEDVPDAAVRAWRDAKGQAHLLSAVAANRALVGPDLDHLRKDCRVIYKASGDPDPSHFDDAGWVESVYTPDGRNVYALVSMDYHPDRHAQRCGSNDSTKGQCWYATIVQIKSTDGGYHFPAPPIGDARFVAGPAQPFSADFTGTIGALVPSNIVKFRNAYYSLISVAADALQKGGECLIRNSDLNNVKGWKAWDGQDFTLGSGSPYSAPNSGKGNPCIRLHDLNHVPVRSLLTLDNGFVLVALDQGGGNEKSAVIAQTSTDLIHWSAAVTVMEVPVYRPNGGAKGEHGYYYPSLIDPNSRSLNFDTLGSTAYLYLTKYTYGAGANRDIVKFPLRVEQKSALAP